MTNPNEEIRNILVLKTEVKTKQIEANKKIKALRKRIKNGETTGDKIKDFVIIRYGFVNEEIEAVYRNLKTRIQQHVGEFVLMVTREKEHSPLIESTSVPTRLHFGILSESTLALDFVEGECEIPTNNHVVCQEAWRHESMELVKGNLNFISFRDLALDLDKPLKDVNVEDYLQVGPYLMLEIKIGNTEVKAWFEKQLAKYYCTALNKMTELLNRPMP